MRSRHLVDPELLPAVDGFPAMTFSYDTLADVRAMVESFGAAYVPPLGDGVTREDVMVAGLAGDPDVRVLLYKTAPAADGAQRPAILYIHGGGFFSGKADLYEDWCRRLVTETGAVVAAVDYRKAPEAPHPAPIDDCSAALLWLHRSAAALGIDPARIAVEGVSAGGALAAALTLRARDEGKVSLAFQLLDYPMLDDRTGRGDAPRDPFAGDYVWTYNGNAFGWETLLGDEVGGEDVSPYAAPARATSLEGLPPAFIGVGALDPLMRENVDYAMRLMYAGVPTQLIVYPGAYHGFDAFDDGRSAIGDDFRNARITALKRALGARA
ncbi:alpha/beta hydrolase [Sphingobium sp. EM0848]|uniref:alpha/beta hydrolase n=1 Tax=Sphingobium sp. EM0848 TaxID=2743473 RepID=UPI00159C5D1E|nr:alpha/beta hydrolase [Sphingobium sp. EM0848]